MLSYHIPVFSGFGFVGRFLLALFILWFLNKQNPTQSAFRKGLNILTLVGIIAVTLSVFAFIAVVFFGGISAFMYGILPGISNFFHW